MKLLDIFRVLLLPLVPVYLALVYLRNLFFERGIYSVSEVAVPVISVGNLTVGGSGKTPFTMYLANLLKHSGWKPGILSRGYGRKSDGYLLVNNGSEFLTDVEKAGDEIYMAAKECNVPAAVCEDRVTGAENFLKETGINILLLDDAFQHRWIKRDLDIVIIEQRFLTGGTALRRIALPTGNLREPIPEVRRADCVILNRKFSAKEEIPVKYRKYFEGLPLFTGYYSAEGFIDVRDNKFYDKSIFENQKSLLLCGIANPYSFITLLEVLKIDSKDRLIFRDHKYYTIDEVQLIRREFYARNSHSVITTEKDAVKLSRFKKELDDIDIYAVKITMHLDDEEEWKKFLMNALKENSNKQNRGNENNSVSPHNKTT